DIVDASFRFARRQDAIDAEAATDGLHVVRTSLETDRLDEATTGRSSEALGLVERAFRCLKSVDLQLRPVRHWLPERVRAHVFLCMLGYYLQWHTRHPT